METNIPILCLIGVLCMFVGYGFSTLSKSFEGAKRYPLAFLFHVLSYYLYIAAFGSFVGFILGWLYYS